MAREAVACGLLGFGFGLLGWALTSRIHMCIIWNMTRWPVDISLTCRRLHSPIIPLLFLLLGLSCECSPVSMMHRPFLLVQVTDYSMLHSCLVALACCLVFQSIVFSSVITPILWMPDRLPCTMSNSDSIFGGTAPIQKPTDLLASIFFLSDTRRQTKWKSLLAALPSPQHREQHPVVRLRDVLCRGGGH